MLARPVPILSHRWMGAWLSTVMRKGRPIAVLTHTIPRIEPAPKTKIYKRPQIGVGIVARTKSIKAALPAKPWTMPTRRDLPWWAAQCSWS